MIISTHGFVKEELVNWSGLECLITQSVNT